MGVLYDYFRAAADATAIAIVENGGPASRGREDEGVDVVDAKGIDHAVILGKLIALAHGVTWNVKTSDSTLVWSYDEDEGPWLIALVDSTRDTLAAVPDAQMPDLAAGWSQIEEFTRFSPVTAEQMLPAVTEFVGLARRAVDAGDHLYCWCCL